MSFLKECAIALGVTASFVLPYWWLVGHYDTGSITTGYLSGYIVASITRK